MYPNRLHNMYGYINPRLGNWYSIAFGHIGFSKLFFSSIRNYKKTRKPLHNSYSARGSFSSGHSDNGKFHIGKANHKGGSSKTVYSRSLVTYQTGKVQRSPFSVVNHNGNATNYWCRSYYGHGNRNFQN